MDMKELRERKQTVLQDMLACIRYTPNRESDLLAFMEQYRKGDRESRPGILENLRRCMDGEPYPDPYRWRRRYTEDTVAQCDRVLEEYFSRLQGCAGDPDTAGAAAKEMVRRLNQLNDVCGGQLIDSWRRDRLRDVIDCGLELAGGIQNQGFTASQRM